MSKLHDFAQAVGADIKEIKTTLAGKADKGEVTANGITQDQLNTAIAQAKTDIIGGAPRELDTLKEIADKINSAGGNTDSGIISKMSELGTRLDTIEQEDLVSVYNTAKNTL
nr:MAG TPA: Heat shock factor-binding protein 1 helix, Nucleus, TRANSCRIPTION.8A [Caudoviricetes sp.]